jgi:hypothetical protein
MSANEGGMARKSRIAAEIALKAVEHMFVWTMSLKAMAPVRQCDPTTKISKETNAPTKILEPIGPNSKEPTSA